MTDHWTSDPTKKGAFLNVAGELGLERGEIQDALGVESLDEYTGTLQAAYERVNQYAAGDTSPPPEEPPPPSPAPRSDPARAPLQAKVFEHASQVPEAPASATAKFQSPSGAVWLCTVRAGMPEPLMLEAMRSLVSTMETFEKAVVKGREWAPVVHTSEVPLVGAMRGSNGSGQGRGAPQSGQAGSAPARSQAQAPPRNQPAESAPGYTKVGTGELLELVCKDGVFEFNVQGRKYPLKDARGSDSVVGLFEPSCWDDEFAPEALEGKVILDADAFGQKLYVRFGKSENGYWDVLSVFPQ